MKFEVRNRQDWDRKPCKEAVEQTKAHIDIRGVDSPYKIWNSVEEVQKEWHGIGKNHQVKNGRIMRQLGDKVYWTVEFETLADLISFQERHGRIMISDLISTSDLPLIEINV